MHLFIRLPDYDSCNTFRCSSSGLPLKIPGEKCISGWLVKWLIMVPLSLDSACGSHTHNSTSCLFVLMSVFGRVGGGRANLFEEGPSMLSGGA